MARLDFITNADLRGSLERDEREMVHAMNAKCWKSVHLLSGSIVEALLVEHLTSERPDQAGLSDLSLDALIEQSERNGAITPRTADLCSVVRTYRNLIHPGRMIRQQESPPSEQSAQIAMALVDLIAEDIAKARKRTYGLTAEQVTEKLVLDHNAVGMLPQLLREVGDLERERLLVEVLPKRYFGLSSTDGAPFDWTEQMWRLRQGFRQAFDSAKEETKSKVTKVFVNILKEGSGTQIETYARVFFRRQDLKWLDETDLPLVKGYYLSQVPLVHNVTSAREAKKLAPYLAESDMPKWTDPFLTVLLSPEASVEDRTNVRAALLDTQTELTTEAWMGLDRRVDEWIALQTAKKHAESVMLLTGLKDEIRKRRELVFREAASAVR